jgi:hypothetical protein
MDASIETKRLLYAGEFICPFAFERSYQWMTSDESHQTEVNHWLIEGGLRLESTQSGFYAATLDFDKSAARALFNKALNEIRPILYFMFLIKGAKVSDSLLQAGEQLHVAAIAADINNSAELDKQLRALLQSLKLSKANGHDNYEKLVSIFNALTKTGILYDSNHGRYKVTGKIDFYYELIESLEEQFIAEGLLENDTPLLVEQQMDIFE